jgi:hypothetical protein
MLHVSYSRWWAATIPTAVVSYLLGGPAWLTGGALAIAAVVEIVAAVVRRKPGDTLSEHIWIIARTWPALWSLVAGLAVALVWLPLTLLPGTRGTAARVLELTGGLDPAVVALALGTLLWLVVHFGARGRFG